MKIGGIAKTNSLTNNYTPTNSTTPHSGRAPEYDAGYTTESGFLDAAENWLGPNYTSYPNGRYVSEDGMHQVRYGNHETKNPNDHHGHFEAYDIPAQNGGEVIENSRVKIFSDTSK